IGVLHLSQLLPLSEAGLWSGAVADPRGVRAAVYAGADAPHPQEPRMSATTAEGGMTGSRSLGGMLAALWEGRTKYLLGAIMLTLAVIMLLPIYATITASVKLPA